MSLEVVLWEAPEPEDIVEANHQYARAEVVEEAIEFLEEIGLDLESALNYIRQYQRAMHMFAIPDPNGDGPQLLLQKYNMHHKKPSGSITQSKVNQLRRGDDRGLPA